MRIYLLILRILEKNLLSILFTDTVALCLHEFIFNIQVAILILLLFCSHCWIFRSSRNWKDLCWLKNSWDFAVQFVRSTSRRETWG